MGERVETSGLLAHLIGGWQEAHPGKAAGGSWAIAGFGFQFDVALLKMLEDWVRLPPLQRETPTTLVEQLSDVVTAAIDEPVVVLQLKLSQSSAAIRSGLEDLLTVYEVAEAIAHERLGEIRFGLGFRSGDPASAAPIVKRWADEDPAARADLAVAVEVNVYPDPGAEVVELLANRFNADKPSQIHRRWVGDLIAAASLPVPEERAAALRVEARSIGRALTDLDRATRPRSGIRLLSPQDRAPDELGEGEVLVGQRPTIDHLRHGFFAARPAVTERLRQRFLSWMEENEGPAISAPVRVFWIGGRSGSGKSVALIQLLVSLRQEGWDPILWLAEKSHLLAEAARWSSASGQQGGPPIIALDDPYAPALSRTKTWDSFLAERCGETADGNAGGQPVLICCGPTEQAEMLKRDFPDDLEVTVVELEREQTEDLERLRAWYETRTGRTAPIEVDENILLVQLFFQWRTGRPLRSFAERFRRRIEASDPDGAILRLLAEVLAVNRLYVGFPAQAATRRLSDAQEDMLDRLRREEHVAIDAENGRSGLWLAHPHLANGIYEAWFPSDSHQRERQGHFREAALESMREGADLAERLAPIQAVALGLTTGVAAIRDRVDPGVVDVLPAIYYTAQTMHEGGSPIDELSLWIDVQMATGAVFDPDPVEEALKLLTPQACQLPATARLCETLLTRIDRLTPEQEEDLIGIVSDLLVKVQGWAAWARVASAAVRARPSKQLTGLIADWARRNEHIDSAGSALAASIESLKEDTSQLRAQALRLLRDRPRHRQWGKTWLALWARESDDGLRRMGLEHLESTPDDRDWASMWTTLARSLKSEAKARSPLENELREQLPEIGRRWLQEDLGRLGWSLVWSKLSGWEPSSWLETLGRRWLEQTDASSRAFSFVWLEIWQGGRRDLPLRDEGIEALSRIDFDHPAWGYIYVALCDVEPSPELRAIGLNWVRTASPNGPAWGYVLPALRRSVIAEDDANLHEELEQAALRFLQQAGPEHGGWSYVFEGLQGREATEELRRRGLRWLSETPHDHHAWARTWKRLLNPMAPSTQLERDAQEEHLKIGEDWLFEAPIGDYGWSHVFLALWARRPSRELRSFGRRWLRQSGPAPAWDMVWRILWLGADRHGDRLELNRRALAWLRLQQDHKRWPTVWEQLWDFAPTEQLRGLGRTWADGSGRRHPRRRNVTKRLEATGPPRPPWGRKAERLTKWMAGNPIDFALCEAIEILQDQDLAEASWPLAWKRLWEKAWKQVRTRELQRAGLTWLEVPLPEGPYGRSYVWKALWRHEKSKRLHRIGCSYLASAKRTRTLWAPIWFELWRFEPTEELRQLGHSRIAANPSDQDGRMIRRRLEKHPPTPGG